MLRGLYHMAGAMERASRNHEVATENLVNAMTPGYRRQAMLFEATEASFASEATPAPARLVRNSQPSVSSFTYFSPGSPQQTNDPLDFAVSGDGFFTVEGPNGPLYTRNGTFQIGANGELQTRGGGYRVSGQGGPITVPPGAGAINVAADGTVTANGSEIGRLRLASFDNPQTLRRVGPTLFEGDAPQTPQAGKVRVEQGYREGSNVQPVQEMMTMMMGLRFYEAAQKAMQSLSDTVSQNTRPQ